MIESSTVTTKIDSDENKKQREDVMGVHILRSTEGDSCLYCSTSDWAFGPIFFAGEDPQDFLDWLVRDPRILNDSELANRVAEWREGNEVCEKCDKQMREHDDGECPLRDINEDDDAFINQEVRAMNSRPI
jgi:hypothetical protein